MPTKGPPLTPGGKSRMPAIALLVSLCALSISGWTLFLSYLAPFEPLVTVGSIVWHPAEAPRDQPVPENQPKPVPNAQWVTKSIALLVPFTFTHQGGRPGVIEDVVILLNRIDKPGEWLFVPQVFVDERAYSTNLGPNDALKWITAFYCPVALSKGEQIQRFILFVASDDSRFSGSIEPGRYTIRLSVQLSGHPNYSEVEHRTDMLTADVLADLLKSKAAVG